MTLEEQLIRSEQRASAYKLLSDCYQSPDEDFPDRLRELERVRSGLYPDIQPDFSEGELLRSGRMTAEQLKVEHARLFVGPFSLPVPPYGSMYLEQDGHLMAGSTLEVLKWYQSEGMEIAIKEVPDHICVELEFMYLLVYREMKAQDMDMMRDYREKQVQFLDQNLARWIPAFEKKVREHAEIWLYSELAAATRRFIAADLDELRRDFSN